MKATIETSEHAVRAYLITILDNTLSALEADSVHKELIRLARTLDVEIVGAELIKVRNGASRYGLGSGKAEELSVKFKEEKIDCVIFDKDISPARQRNWEELINIPVIDRKELIIKIFAGRAKTREAVLQVELAELEHRLPRLAHAYIDLSRQRGGRYGTKGSGETKLELDRRTALRRIHLLKAELEEVRKNRNTQRKRRDRISLPSCALVGYTNAGKSSLLNALTVADALAEDKLFATLDPTTRRMVLGKNRTILLTDTVGFIRRLPHELVDAFHSTLEEAALAELLIEVLDATDPELEIHHQTTMAVLHDLGADLTSRVMVLNKIDGVKTEERGSYLKRLFPDAIAVSALTGEGLSDLAEHIDQKLSTGVYRFSFPSDRHDLPAFLHREASVLAENYLDDSIEIEARVDARVLESVRKYIRPL